MSYKFNSRREEKTFTEKSKVPQPSKKQKLRRTAETKILIIGHNHWNRCADHRPGQYNAIACCLNKFTVQGFDGRVLLGYGLCVIGWEKINWRAISHGGVGLYTVKCIRNDSSHI